MTLPRSVADVLSDHVVFELEGRQVPAALMLRYQSDWRPKFKPMTTVSPVRKARTGVWRKVPDLRPTCSRSANAAWPAR